MEAKTLIFSPLLSGVSINNPFPVSTKEAIASCTFELTEEGSPIKYKISKSDNP
ncbi:hypothetical protein LLF85_06330 [bacterium]|nr:hypothetical protein [bacterium]